MSSTCASTTCASSTCTSSTCATSITTKKSVKTIPTTTQTTCRSCKSKERVCKTRDKVVTKYEASGNEVTCQLHRIAQQTEDVGIRAVFTIKKSKKGN